MVHYSTVIACLAGAASVSAHGVFVATTGSNGQAGAGGFGMDPSTPRDGTTRVPFQQDASIIRNRELASGQTGPCGRTLKGGNNDVTQQLSAAESQGLADVGSDGTVKMTLHQVNQDGAGPYSCGVSTDASGSKFVNMQVTKNVPGFASLSLAQAEDFQMEAQMLAGTKCTGGADGATCLVMCRNQALAGPFGGCMAFTQGAQGGNATAAPTAAANKAASAKTQTASATADDEETSTDNGGAGGQGGAGDLLGKLSQAVGNAETAAGSVIPIPRRSLSSRQTAQGGDIIDELSQAVGNAETAVGSVIPIPRRSLASRQAAQGGDIVDEFSQAIGSAEDAVGSVIPIPRRSLPISLPDAGAADTATDAQIAAAEAAEEAQDGKAQRRMRHKRKVSGAHRL